MDEEIGLVVLRVDLECRVFFLVGNGIGGEELY